MPNWPFRKRKSYKTIISRTRGIFDAGAFLSGEDIFYIRSDDDIDVEVLAAEVAWTRRAINLRANAFSNMPWDLMRGDDPDPVATEKDWWDWPPWLTGYFEGFKQTLNRLERAKVLYGAGYLFEMQGKRTKEPKGFRWMRPDSIKPKLDAEAGLVGFERNIGKGEPIPIDIERLLWSWIPNESSEVGPGRAPAESQKHAAEVIRQMNRGATTAYKRGPLLNTLVILPSEMSPEDADRMVADLKRDVAGTGNAGTIRAWRPVSNEAQFKTEQFGIEPVKLAMPQVSESKVQEIAAAFDIPLSVMTSKASRNWTDQADDVRFYEYGVNPSWEDFRDRLNDQCSRFPPPNQDYWFKMRPDRLEAYQLRESQKAQAYVQMTGKPFMLRNEAREAIGLERLEKWESDAEDQPAPPQPPPPAAATAQPTPDEIIESAKLWAHKSKSQKRLAEWHSQIMPENIKALIGKTYLLHGHDVAFGWMKTIKDVRDAEVKAFEAGLSELMNTHGEKVLRAIESGSGVDEAVAAMSQEYETLLQNSYSRIGMAQATKLAAEYGIVFDPADTSAQIMEWARAHAYERSRLFNSTTHKAVRKAVETFEATPEMTFQQLSDLMAPTLDPAGGRPNTAAITEVTDAVESTTKNYQAMLQDRVGVKMVRRWNYAGGPCPTNICPPLDGMLEDESGNFSGYDAPPAHPNCYCFTTLELAEGENAE